MDKKKRAEYTKWYYSYTARGRFNRLRDAASSQYTNFNIDPWDFIRWYESQPQTCYYCGAELTKGKDRKHKLTDETFDRKDNARGYTMDNIALACRRCNLMKGDWLTEQQMLEIARKYFKS